MQAFWYLRKRVFHRSKELHIGLTVYMERNTPKFSQQIDSFKNCFSLFSVLLLESYRKTISFPAKPLLQSTYVMRKHGSHLPITKLACSENIHTYYIVVP